MKTIKLFLFLALVFFTFSFSSVSADEVTSEVTINVLIPVTNIQISGTAKVGEVLTAVSLTPSAATVTYKWQSLECLDLSNGQDDCVDTWVDISGATSITYTIAEANVGGQLRVLATGYGTYYDTRGSMPTANVVKFPTLTAPTFSSITTNSATLSSNITDAGYPGTIIERGFYWFILPASQSSEAIGGITGSGTGVFTKNLTNLTPGTKYGAYAWGKNSAGATYTATTYFTTTAATPPTIISQAATNITASSADIRAQVTNMGDPGIIIERGLCYGLSANPRSNCAAVSGSDLNIFSRSISSLTASTTYHYAGYARNTGDSGNNVYTSDATFTTTAPTYYTITYDKNNTDAGSTNANPTSKSNIISGGNVGTLPTAPTRTGYTFNGWATTSGGGTAFTASTAVTSSYTVYAQWTITQYTITFDKNNTDAGSTNASPTTRNANYNTTVTLPTAPTRTGYTFNGWATTSGGGTAFTASTAVTSSYTVYAQWTINTYTLTAAKNGTGTGTVTSASAGISCGADCSEVYNYGTSVTLTAAASLDSSFSGWSGGGCSGTGTCTTTVDSTKTVTATFTLIPVITGISATNVVSGTASQITFSANYANFCFVSVDYITSPYQWSGLYSSKPASIATSTSLSVGTHTASVICVNTDSVGSNGGSWTDTTFTVDPPGQTLTVSKSGLGTVTSADLTINCGGTCSRTYTVGTDVVLTAVASTGYTFNSWAGCDSSSGSTCNIRMNSAQNVTATFEINKFNIVASTGSNGTVTPTGTTVKDYGSSQVYSITPSANYHVLDVLVDGASVGAVSTYTFSSISADHTISATFTLDTFTLTSTKNGTGNGTVTSSPIGISCGADCSQVYDYGTSVTLTAAASLDSSFSGWSGGGCSGKGSCVMSVTSNQTVTATFTKIPVITSLTVSPDPVDFGTSTNISFTADYASNLCAIILDLDGGSPIWIGASGSHTANTGNLNVEGAHNASVACANTDNVFNPPYIISFIVSPDDIAPTISPITAIGETKFYATWNLQFNIEGNDADIGDKIHYVVDWMDGTPNTTTPTVVISSSGLPGYTRMTVNHTWPTTGSKTFRAQTVDLKGKTSAWEQFTFTAKILPPLPVIDLLQSNKLLNQIEFNDTVNIKWESSNADSCSMATNTAPGVNIISNFSDAQSLDNNKDFIPPQKTIYTLKCINDAGEANKSLPIMVGKMDPTITEF